MQYNMHCNPCLSRREGRPAIPFYRVNRKHVRRSTQWQCQYGSRNAAYELYIEPIEPTRQRIPPQ